MTRPSVPAIVQEPDELRREVASHALLLRGAWERARARFGDLAVGFEIFAEHAVRVTRIRLEGSLAAPSSRDVGAALGAAALEDVYLALACDLDREDAWNRLDALLSGPLHTIARRRGAGAGEAEELARDVIGDLMLRNAERGNRTPLGSFAGAGSLVAWASGMLLRRRARAPSRKAPLPHDLPDAPPGDRSTAVGPAEAAEVAELGRRLDATLKEGFRGLTERERVALLSRFRNELPQVAIARVLGVGEPRVTRLLQSGISKLQKAARAVTGPLAGDASAHLWDALARTVGNHLASLEVPKPPERSGWSHDDVPR